jgi:pimeloyl-ACP methyl ester carboxylesterase
MNETTSKNFTTTSGIAVSESGPSTGEVIVLIHGSLDRMAGMAYVARLLQRDHHVIRYDRRGYGKSWPHSGPFSIDEQIDDLVEVLAGRHAFLIGHSFGGHIALGGAIRLGLQIAGVSMYESPLSWMSWWPGTTAGNRAIAADAEEAAETFMRRLVGDERWESLPAQTKLSRRREGIALVGELSSLRSGEPYDMTKVQVPVLCGFGEKGAERHERGARFVAANVPEGHATMIHEAGHGAPTSHPQAYIDALVTPHLMSGRSTLMS